MPAPKQINKGLVPANLLFDEAKKAIDDWGVTDLYSTGDQIIDEYLGNSVRGGYGRRNGGYEILTIFGNTGMNKSTFATSMILSPAENGTQIAYFALEDDPKDVIRRIITQCNGDEGRVKRILDNILFMPENDGYTLEMMAEAIEEIFEIADIVLIDPISMIFESSVAERSEAEFNRQRIFMRRMNTVMKHTNKTLILVSHTNKAAGGKDTRSGLDKLYGSSSIAQVSTKIVEIDRKENIQGIRLWKSRFSPYRYTGIQVRLENMNVRAVYTKEELPQARAIWSGQNVQAS